MTRCSVFAVCAFLPVACANMLNDHPSHLALYSWKPVGKPWHFALVPDPSRAVSRAAILTMTTPLVGVAALESRLASTPRTTWAIMWRDDPPEYTLRYPPAAIRKQIIAFGKQHGLNIEIWPTLYE
jgi:hypothetical protein